MQPQTVAQELLEFLSVGGIESGAEQRLANLLLLIRAAEVDAQQILRLLGGGALGEVDQINGVPPSGQQMLERLVQRRLAVLVVQRHRPLGGANDRHFPPGELPQTLFDRGHVAQRRGHQKEGAAIESEERNLPGDAPLPVGVIVKLIHDDVIYVWLIVAQRHVGENLGGATNDRRVAIDRRVPGQHSHLLGSERLAQREELLVHQRLDRTGVEGGFSLAHRFEVERHRHQRFSRTGGSVEDQVLAREQLEDRFFLRGVERKTGGGDKGDEPVEDLVRAERGLTGFRQQLGETHRRLACLA